MAKGMCKFEGCGFEGFGQQLAKHYKENPTHRTTKQRATKKAAKRTAKASKRGRKAAVATGGNVGLTAALAAIDAEIVKLTTARAALVEAMG